MIWKEVRMYRCIEAYHNHACVKRQNTTKHRAYFTYMYSTPNLLCVSLSLFLYTLLFVVVFFTFRFVLFATLFISFFRMCVKVQNRLPCVIWVYVDAVERRRKKSVWPTMIELSWTKVGAKTRNPKNHTHTHTSKSTTQR